MNARNDGWSLPSMARVGVVGVLCIIVLFLIGALDAMPYIKSPITRLETTIGETRKQIYHHNRASRTQTELQRMICRGTWKGNDEMQRTCEKVGAGPEPINGDGER